MKHAFVLFSFLLWALAVNAQNTNPPTVTNVVAVASDADGSKNLAGGLVEFLAQAIDFADIEGLKLTLDPKALDKGSFGLDFSASYERLLIGEDGVAGNKFFADIKADGYVASDRE